MSTFKKWFQLAIWLGLSLHGNLTQAVIVPHLYDVTLPTQTQSDEERRELLKQGLLQVLERISGESQPTVEVTQALQQASDFVEQYAYQGTQLHIKYSPELVNQLIYQTGNTVWGQRRPSVLLWLVIEDQQQQRIIGTETDPQLQAEFLDIAKQKGLPLLLPLMDLEDVSSISVADIGKGTTIEEIQQASKRYGAQAILIGRMGQRTPGKWQSHWQLLTENASPTWDGHGQSLNEVFTQGLNQTTRYLIGDYGVKSEALAAGSQARWLMEVKNVSSAADFSKVEAYLHRMEQVQQVSVYQIVGNKAIFEIMPKQNVNQEALMRALSLEPHFVLEDKHQSKKNIDLVYRWIQNE